MELGLGYVFSALFQNVYARGFRLSLQKRFKTCFARGYARMRFATEDFFDYALPSVQVRADIIESLAIDFYVQWRRRRAVQNSVESHVFADAVRKEETGDNALVNDVQTSCIV
jgi:hypothetical protein